MHINIYKSPHHRFHRHHHHLHPPPAPPIQPTTTAPSSQFQPLYLISSSVILDLPEEEEEKECDWQSNDWDRESNVVDDDVDVVVYVILKLTEQSIPHHTCPAHRWLILHDTPTGVNEGLPVAIFDSYSQHSVYLRHRMATKAVHLKLRYFTAFILKYAKFHFKIQCICRPI